MAKYNSIIKELPGDGKGPAKILGRMFLQDLSQIPDGWEVKLRDSFIRRHTDIQQLMCTFVSPLVIYKKSSVKILSDEDEIRFGQGMMAGDVWKAFDFLGATSDFDDGAVCEGLQTTFSTRLNNDDTPIDGVGVETNHFWKSYTYGMNLSGECPSTECESRNHAEGGNQVFYHNGYGEIYLPDDEHKFNCPACNGSSFHISNFVLSCGRALFKYKKSGIDSEVKEFILESDGPLEEYKTFGMTDSDHPVTDYDFVLIMTVATDQSFYYCISCDKTIDEVEDEEMLSCGHSYHKSTCSPGSTLGCVVCNSTTLESISSLLTIGNS